MLLMILEPKNKQEHREREREREREGGGEGEGERDELVQVLSTNRCAYLDEFLLVHHFDQDGDQSGQLPKLHLQPLHLDPLHARQDLLRSGTSSPPCTGSVFKSIGMRDG